MVDWSEVVPHVGLFAGWLPSKNWTVKYNMMGFMFGLPVSGITLFLVLKELRPQDITKQFIPEWNTNGQDDDRIRSSRSSSWTNNSKTSVSMSDDMMEWWWQQNQTMMMVTIMLWWSDDESGELCKTNTLIVCKTANKLLGILWFYWHL